MKLADYRRLRGLNLKQMADLIGVTQVTVSRYEAGQRKPSADQMQSIFDATGGAVTPNDFYDLAGRAA